ncbi:MAG TPA: RodZ domain-containing protein [Gammaproteobacteria bacterium]
MGEGEQPSEPAAPPPPATLGERLRAARLAQDLTVEQLATELRIEAKQLHALEENRFEQIGVPVFVKGYLKQYGTRLGLDVADLLALYYEQTTLADVQIRPNRTIKLRDERQITSWVLAAIVLLTVIVGLAAWWWNGGSFGAALPAETAAAPAESTAAPAPAPPPAEPERPTPVQEQRPAPASAAGAAVVESAEPDAPPAEPPALADAADRNDVARPAAGVTAVLELAFDAESWAEITDARGERLLFGLNAAGRNVTLRGEPPFAILLGDADSVRLTVDGDPYAIPKTGRQGKLARFSVDLAEE